MKKIYFSLVLLGLTCGATAQTNVYHPFPDTTACWSVDGYSMNCQGYCDTYFYRMSGDTVINSLLYKKIYLDYGYVSYQWYNNQLNPVYYNQSPPTFACGIRQDIVQKKVWIYINNFDSLLYDFSRMNVGDTIKTYAGTCAPPTNTVSAIDSVILNGTYRKRYKIRNSMPSNPNDTVSIIEGVGSNNNPFGCSLMTFFEDGYILNCINSFPVDHGYMDNSSHCCLAIGTGIEDATGSGLYFSISPNPSPGKFVITSSTTISKIEIFDVLGKQIQKLEVKSQKCEVNISEQPKGIYFVKVWDEKGNAGVKKIVLQ